MHRTILILVSLMIFSLGNSLSNWEWITVSGKVDSIISPKKFSIITDSTTYEVKTRSAINIPTDTTLTVMGVFYALDSTNHIIEAQLIWLDSDLIFEKNVSNSDLIRSDIHNAVNRIVSSYVSRHKNLGIGLTTLGSITTFGSSIWLISGISNERQTKRDFEADSDSAYVGFWGTNERVDLGIPDIQRAIQIPLLIAGITTTIIGTTSLIKAKRAPVIELKNREISFIGVPSFNNQTIGFQISGIWKSKTQ